MNFRWLKPYMPRSLYGRAILILLLPVASLLLVISIVFIQRHFEGVTKQMTQAVSREVSLLLEYDASTDNGQGAQMASVLQIAVDDVTASEMPQANQRRWYDFTGVVVISEFSRLLPNVRAIELPNDKVVRLFFETQDGAMALSFDRRRVSASNPHQLLVYMAVFGVLMTVIAFLYLRNQLRPITRLARAAEAFGRGRHDVYRPAGAIEVRAAGNAFLDMRARIERQIEQRTLMLSGVSHDLRTPLTRLKLGLSMLDDEDVDLMQRDVADMERLLDEFLAFARGAHEGEPKRIDPIKLMKQIVADCDRAKIDATLVSAEGSGKVALREGGIRRAVENLINNAVRYGTRAELSVLLTDKTLRIRVEDDGPGIPEHQREEALKPFARLDPARNQDKGSGVGLGLAITADITRVHGGTLRLGTSETLGGLRADIVIGR
ncbi:ATP-binding protein [uncultured Roseovarius sp.]|uniref:ATP-binding protein n=1 Tax=uncultured Roseovarius sp. TaxID=293344 RepID=UPI00263995C1|nr:ATP-binding protein [uncultured Roseovarius sp.]